MGKIKTFLLEREAQWNLEPTYGDDLDEDWTNFQKEQDSDESK